MEVLIGLLCAGSIGVAAWWFVRCAFKIEPPAHKPIADTDLYGIKARELALQAKKKLFWEQRQEWQNEFAKLVQSTCKHEYDMHANQWYVCTKCKYEKPWYYRDGCSCATSKYQHYVNSHYTHRLIRRSGTCNVHGRDFEKYKQEAMKWHLQQQKYSKGGIIN